MVFEGIQHIGIIMDGNRRWAREKGLKEFQGHEKGAETLKKISEFCRNNGLKYLTVYALSSENLKNRSKEELIVHFRLHKDYMKKHILDTDKAIKDNVRFNVIGKIESLPKDEQKMIKECMEKTKNCKNHVFTVCLSYDGQDEIVDAVKKIINEGIKPEKITRDILKKHLYSYDLPAPEIIIRTGMNGEERLSGFLLWDSSYSELFFTKTKWPDFSSNELIEICNKFNNRERRFGK